jgi:hypothetical protein
MLPDFSTGFLERLLKRFSGPLPKSVFVSRSRFAKVENTAERNVIFAIYACASSRRTLDCGSSANIGTKQDEKPNNAYVPQKNTIAKDR